MIKKLTAVLLALLLPTSPASALSIADISTETVFKIMDTQVSPTWGLDRIDGVADGKYSYLSGGLGVRIYIVDTGVQASSPEFESRVVDGFDAFQENRDQIDCNGHGTHVAGIVAGKYFGVAKQSTIVPIRVLDCNGVGDTSTVVDGINWILKNHPAGTPGIVNMSFGGDKDVDVDGATELLVNSGFLVVAAAGNSNSDSCYISPAGAKGVITVGATDIRNYRASFSNWGKCVEVFSPGVDINSVNSTNSGVSSKRSGTSQAAPFVSGILATYLSNKSVTSSASALPYLLKTAQKNVIFDSKSTESYFPIVESSAVATPELAAPTPLPAPEVAPSYEPVSVVQRMAGSSLGTLSWPTVQGASSYKIYKTGSIRPKWRLWFTVASGSRSYKTIIDKPGSIAVYRIVAVVNSKEVEVGRIKYVPSR